MARAILIAIILAAVYRCSLPGNGHPFDYASGHETALELNGILQPGSVVLCYEVQWRYWLRDDISMLSLDGITDGKIGRGDMIKFLRMYKPDCYIPSNPPPNIRGAEILRRLESGEQIGGVRFARLGNVYQIFYKAI